LHPEQFETLTGIAAADGAIRLVGEPGRPFRVPRRLFTRLAFALLRLPLLVPGRVCVIRFLLSRGRRSG